MTILKQQAGCMPPDLQDNPRCHLGFTIPPRGCQSCLQTCRSPALPPASDPASRWATCYIKMRMSWSCGGLRNIYLTNVPLCSSLLLFSQLQVIQQLSTFNLSFHMPDRLSSCDCMGEPPTITYHIDLNS